MGLIISWEFSITDYITPWLENTSPLTPADKNALISADILDEYSGVDLNTLDAYVNGSLAFSGPATFIVPYNGPYSDITATIVDGYHGYHLVMDNIGEFTKYSLYTVRIIGRDAYGNSFDDSFSFRVEAIPSIIDLSANLYEITLDLVFDAPMLEDSNFVDPANYHFNNGMYTRKVDLIDGYNIRLWVENFFEHNSFTLTVDQKVKSIDGHSFPIDADSFDIAPFKSDATFTNYNAMVRTWHESIVIVGDSQRIYLAGDKGIDVFRRESSRFARWGQIFDEYGIDAMYVANFPSDLIITDTVPPTLIDQVPSPLSTASANTHISFKVKDAITAVEITTLRVYINTILAFSGMEVSGYSGWQNDWSGEILIEPHQLCVELWHDTPFSAGSTVKIRVIAQDLIGNEMDASYNFHIGGP